MQEIGFDRGACWSGFFGTLHAGSRSGERKRVDFGQRGNAGELLFFFFILAGRVMIAMRRMYSGQSPGRQRRTRRQLFPADFQNSQVDVGLVRIEAKNSFEFLNSPFRQTVTNEEVAV